MRRILVPLDGSEIAEEAIGPALRLAARHGAEVRLVSVVAEMAPPMAVTPDATEASVRWVEQEEKARRGYLDAVRSRAAAGGKGVTVTTRIEVGRAAPMLLEATRSFDADLVVLTTHGRGAWTRFWLGSVADQLLRASTVPLLFLRGGAPTARLFDSDASPERVFVPLDGSTAGEAVFPVLRSLLPRTRGRVAVVSVARDHLLPLSPYLPDATWERALIDEEKKRLRHYVDRANAKFGGEGIGQVDARLLEGGDVARTLLAAIEEADPELVALSTHGGGAMGRLLVGSVADKLVRGTERPILAVPPNEKK